MVVPLFEIEVDERAEFLRAEQQRTDALEQPLDAAVAIGRVEEMVHGGELERNIGAGDGAGGAVVEDGRGHPERGFAGKELDEFGVALGVGFRFGDVNGGFAEQVDSEAEALVPELF